MPSVSRGIRDLGGVGRLRRRHSVHVALAEFMGIAGGSNRFVVGDHRGDVSAGTGDDAHYGADYRGADEQEGFPEYLEKHAQDHVTLPPAPGMCLMITLTPRASCSPAFWYCAVMSDCPPGSKGIT